MSHKTGTVQSVSPSWSIGPDTGSSPTSPNTWAATFTPVPAPSGTKFVVLHFTSVVLPSANRLEVDLGYDTDVFTSADGGAFWTRPIDVSQSAGQVAVRYITAGSANGAAAIDRYGRGERQPGHQDPNALSNSDPFLVNDPYTEPIYDPYWFCMPPNPRWENVRCAPSGDVRRTVARSVGMIVSVHEDDPAHGPHVSTCSGTLIEPGLFISAGHCLVTDEEAAASSVTFDYETNCDGSVPAGQATRFHKVVRVVARHFDFSATPPYDYVLLQLEPASGGLGVPALGVRHDLPPAGEPVFGVHHPNGAVKKVSPQHVNSATLTSSNLSGMAASIDVAGGSSGSGLFDMQGRYLGILSYGPACGVSYFPIVSVDQDIANPPGPAVSRDVMLVFDRSGSMSMDAGTGSTKIEEAREAASLFVALVRTNAGNRIGLVAFSTGVPTPIDFPPANFNPGARTQLVGPAPYSTGIIGALQPDALTAIGQGLQAGRDHLPAAANPRAILLLTDGLQNVAPWIQDVGPTLGGIDVHAIGYGTAASLDGALLTQLAQAHAGLYTQATDPLALRKFFALAFGNMFQAGALLDPSGALEEDQDESEPIRFDVCGEETVTVVLGWEPDAASLRLRITTPGGQVVQAGVAGVEQDSGRSWSFVRIPLPHGGEREGQWTAEVVRPSITLKRVAGRGPAARYFVNVLAAGGPRLKHVPRSARLYTGDRFNPLVVLRHADGSIPHAAKVSCTVTRPAAAAGDVLAREKLRESLQVGGDTIPARQATLLAVEQRTGAPAIDYERESFDLLDDPGNTKGRFEPHGIFGLERTDLLTTEGDYTFLCRASYGHECNGSRDHVWTLHVDVGIDPEQTSIVVESGEREPGGSRPITIKLTPRDAYGHLLGPGRADAIDISGTPGTAVTGTAVDGGDGTYSVTGSWNDEAVEPGVVIGQPGRPAVVVGAGRPSDGEEGGARMCWWWKLLALILAVIVAVLLLLLLAA